LSSESIRDIPTSLEVLDRDLLYRTGHTLLGLAARTTVKSIADVEREIKNHAAAVVPVSSGAGVIPGFAESVRAILLHIGLKAFITPPDIAGIGEAFESRADLFFAADDHRFLAFNLTSSLVVDNARATAAGFVQALAAAIEVASGDLTGRVLADRDVLVLGLGAVGKHAAMELQRLGARVWVYDSDAAKVAAFSDSNKRVMAVPDIETGLRKINYVFDATPAAGIIDENMIRSTTIISCPGVPHGLTEAALGRIGVRFIHDNLALGVATMAVQCLF
jgi:pyrrolysine biosynthesis protein PylD